MSGQSPSWDSSACPNTVKSAFSIYGGGDRSRDQVTTPHSDTNHLDTPMSAQPNILVILTDQLTQQALSAHGNPHLHTPHMDSLVHSGLSFLNSYCPAPVCGPARGSLLSGRMPHETGVEVNGPAPTPEIPTMGEHFRRAGYRPFYAGKLHLGPRYRKGVQQVGGMQGFDFLCDEYPEGIPRQLGSDTDEVWTDHAVEFLRRQEPRETRAEEPFLLVASLHNPHDICYWVMEWHHIVDIPADSDLPPLPANFQPGADEPEFIGLCRQRTEYGPEMSWTHGWDETDWRRYLYVYYRLTERVDQQIGRLLAALEGSGVAEETLVVLTSDHGEGVAAHKWVTKLMLWEEVVRVPFVMRLPGAVPQNRVDRSHLVSGLDLLPTLCDYANIAAPTGLPGHSVRPVIENPALPGRSCLVTELQAFMSDESKKGRMIRTARYKYVVFSHGQRPELLFDLENDPGETQNLAYESAYREILSEQRALLRKEIEETADSFSFPVD